MQWHLEDCAVAEGLHLDIAEDLAVGRSCLVALLAK